MKIIFYIIENNFRNYFISKIINYLYVHYNYNNFQTIVFPKNNCGGIFSSRTRDMSLVVFWLFLLSHIEEKFLPPLPYKREPKREEYHQLSSFYCGGIFSSRPRVSLVAFWHFFCCPTSKNSSPLSAL